MTPKEKAKDILLDIASVTNDSYHSNFHKQFALKSVDLVLYAISEDVTFWQEVKLEIEAL